MNIYSRTPFYYRRNHGGILLLERADVYTLHVVPRALRHHFRVLARRPNQVYCQGFPRHYANRFTSSQQNHFHSISSPFSSLRVGPLPMSSLFAKIRGYVCFDLESIGNLARCSFSRTSITIMDTQPGCRQDLT